MYDMTLPSSISRRLTGYQHPSLGTWTDKKHQTHKSMRQTEEKGLNIMGVN